MNNSLHPEHDNCKSPSVKPNNNRHIVLTMTNGETNIGSFQKNRWLDFTGHNEINEKDISCWQEQVK